MKAKVLYSVKPTSPRMFYPEMYPAALILSYQGENVASVRTPYISVQIYLFWKG